MLMRIKTTGKSEKKPTLMSLVVSIIGKADKADGSLYNLAVNFAGLKSSLEKVLNGKGVLKSSSIKTSAKYVYVKKDGIQKSVLDHYESVQTLSILYISLDKDLLVRLLSEVYKQEGVEASKFFFSVPDTVNAQMKKEAISLAWSAMVERSEYIKTLGGYDSYSVEEADFGDIRDFGFDESFGRAPSIRKASVFEESEQPMALVKENIQVDDIEVSESINFMVEFS